MRCDVKLNPPSLLAATDVAGDHARLIALWKAAGLETKPQGRDSLDAFEHQLALGTQRVIGVENETGELVGAVISTHDGRKGWINRLAVHPDYRRQGMALVLIRAAEAALREQGITIVAALIEPGNDASVALFEKAGYLDWPGMHYVSKRDSDKV